MTAPDPGRPGTLGRTQDVADADAVTLTVIAVKSVLDRDRPRAGPVRALRIMIWYVWEVPRLPRPREHAHYPQSYPWSPEAAGVYARQRGIRPQKGGWGLVYEHLYPVEYVARDLLGMRRPSKSDVRKLLTERLMGAVITPNDDKLLPKRSKAPKEWDAYEQNPWVRYQCPELHLAQFKPLTPIGSAPRSGR